MDWLEPTNRFRATPLDLLKQGIERKQWEAVQACYTMLTGEVLQAPSDATPVEQIKGKHDIQVTLPPVEKTATEAETSITLRPAEKIAQEIKRVIEDEIYKDPLSECVAPARAANSKDKIFTRARQHDCRPHPNTWKDDQTEAADEIIADRKVPSTILNNQRPPIKNVKVRCQGCGKTEELDPSLVPYGLRLTRNYTMRYLCNGCIVGAKSGAEIEGFSDEEPLFDEEAAE